MAAIPISVLDVATSCVMPWCCGLGCIPFACADVPKLYRIATAALVTLFDSFCILRSCSLCSSASPLLPFVSLLARPAPPGTVRRDGQFHAWNSHLDLVIAVSRWDHSTAFGEPVLCQHGIVLAHGLVWGGVGRGERGRFMVRTRARAGTSESQHCMNPDSPSPPPHPRRHPSTYTHA
jgi:hypothetical protein